MPYEKQDWLQFCGKGHKKRSKNHCEVTPRLSQRDIIVREDKPGLSHHSGEVTIAGDLLIFSLSERNSLQLTVGVSVRGKAPWPWSLARGTRISGSLHSSKNTSLGRSTCSECLLMAHCFVLHRNCISPLLFSLDALPHTYLVFLNL